jgi:cytochrome P450
LRPHIARQKEGVLDIFENHVQGLIHALPKDGSTFDIQDLFSCLMMDIATEVFLGESTNVLRSVSPASQGRAFAQAFEYASLAVCGRGQIDLYEIFSKVFGDRKLKESFGTIDGFLDRVIQNVLRKSEKVDTQGNGEKSRETTFLEDLSKDTQDPQRIKHDILNLLLAGKDTVTALLSNTWFVLSKRPDIYTKLRAEIASLNGERPSGQDLKDLKYLRYVLNECKPPFPKIKFPSSIPETHRLNFIFSNI